jgi:hypothetical protein
VAFGDDLVVAYVHRPPSAGPGIGYRSPIGEDAVDGTGGETIKHLGAGEHAITGSFRSFGLGRPTGCGRGSALVGISMLTTQLRFPARIPVEHVLWQGELGAAHAALKRRHGREDKGDGR